MVCAHISLKHVISHPVNRVFLKVIKPYILVSALIPGKWVIWHSVIRAVWYNINEFLVLSAHMLVMCVIRCSG